MPHQLLYKWTFQVGKSEVSKIYTNENRISLVPSNGSFLLF